MKNYNHFLREMFNRNIYKAKSVSLIMKTNNTQFKVKYLGRETIN